MNLGPNLQVRPHSDGVSTNEAAEHTHWSPLCRPFGKTSVFLFTKDADGIGPYLYSITY